MGSLFLSLYLPYPPVVKKIVRIFSFFAQNGIFSRASCLFFNNPLDFFPENVYNTIWWKIEKYYI